jgi:hypothetical protein
MLASWAYADMALVFYGVASIYALTQYCIRKTTSWLTIAGVTAGFAMGVKYTSFVVPLACGIVLLFHRPFSKAISSAAQFSLVTLMIACPWYIRNLIFMGNPFYPFVFGGRYWDSFLAYWYADSGTGIGWNAIQIIFLPVTITLGTRDVTFFDGRMGTLFLILAPFTLWILWTHAGRESIAGWSLFTIGLFFFLSFAAWTIGVFYSSSLWQARLLFPALLPFTIPAALAWDSLKRFDTSRMQMSFVANSLIVLVIVLTMVDNGIFVVQRNPLAVALGAQSREQYIQRINPSYAALMKLVDDLPAEAQIYSLFEPRSYGLSRQLQPDPINANFAHDVYLYQTPDAILQQWRAKQYTHVIVYERGLDFMQSTGKFRPAMQHTLHEMLARLILISQTPDHIYSLYKIP